jgi:hypothetical protein
MKQTVLEYLGKFEAKIENTLGESSGADGFFWPNQFKTKSHANVPLSPIL